MEECLYNVDPDTKEEKQSMNKLLRITFVIPNANLSGGIRIVAEHARMLHERGHTVTVVSGRCSRPSLKTHIKAAIRGRRVLKVASGPTHLDDVPYRVHTIERHRQITADDVPDADIIFATWWETAEWIARMPKNKGVPVNFLQHYEAHPGQPKDRVDAVWRLPMRKIVVSNWLMDIANNQFDDMSAILVSNGLDTEHFAFKDRGLSGRKIIGAMYTGMSKNNFKRFWLAAETVKVLQGRGIECNFIGFGGRSPLKDELPEGSCFETAPSQQRIANIYASCDCWLFTSDKEGYGLPLLEAMASGTPVVATPAGAAPELLQSGGGKLVDTDDPEVFADAVEAVLDLEDKEWREMSIAARAEAELHSWDKIGDAMENALKQILDESKDNATER
ncbi:MAG: glycosyltransferase family 4 protein [Phycisphaerales bacterium]|nr:glycosyltransferase family 4 protein [Phycisphaerales bacterium]